MNGEIIGFATASLGNRSPVFEEKKLGKVDELFVKEKYRNSGLGKELVDRVVDWLEGKDIELLKIRVLEANERANDFWDSQGFEDHITIKFKTPDGE